MVASGDMIDTRERAYAERLPRADALLASGAVDKLQQREVALEPACAPSRRSTTWPRSAPPRSASSGRASSASRPGSTARRDTPENADLRVRLALMKGVLFYRLHDA